jgi:hypothetical protein
LKGLPLRHLFGVLLLCSSIALIAVVPPSGGVAGATPTPTPLPLLTPAPAATAGIGTPSLVIYPFDVQGGMDKKIGVAMAQITAQQISAAGGINVAPVPDDVTRANFLANARTLKTDYYISGYVTPVGEIAAVVVQLVAVDSGIIIYSQTAQVQTVADVASQALVERDAILVNAHPGSRNAVAEASSTPAPTSTNGANMKLNGISGIVDSVFGKHAKASPKPGSGPGSTPLPKPPRGVIVARVSGPANLAGDLTNATSYLYTALNHFYTTQMTGVTENIAQSADGICGTNRDNTIATGSLAEKKSGGRHSKAQVAFTLTIYTCFGAQLYQEIGTADSIDKAIIAAVAAYATAHPDNN